MTQTFRGLVSAVFYQDPLTALDWLEQAFGFERSMVITDADGSLAHAEMKYAGGYLMVGGLGWSDFPASPKGLGGKTTQTVHVQLTDGLDVHCAHARGAGAVILREPSDEFYGDRVYSARDPEGHVWTFAQTVRAVSVADMEQATGLKIKVWDEELG
jgi:uncharacterized glyoxalase superfamily protein PhnB